MLVTPRRLTDIGRDPVLLGWAYLSGGVSYPCWWLLAPPDGIDPWWIWWVIGRGFVASGALLIGRERERVSFGVFLPSFAATLHLYVLFALNPHSPFYAAAPLMCTTGTLMVMSQRSIQRAYSALVLPASALPLLSGAGPQSLFLIVATSTLLLIANRRFERTDAVQKATASEFRRVLREAEDRLASEKSSRERLEEELEVAQKMESVGWLAGSFAHEFINHLMAIRVYAEILDQSLPRDAALQKDLRAIQEATEGAAGLTARLLALAQGAERDSGPTDLRRVVSGSLVLIQHVMSPQVTVSTRLVEDPCHVPVSANRAEQLLLNLALNARDAMPRGGVFSVEVSRCTRQRRRAARARSAPTSWCGSRSATPASASTPELRPRIFEPFFSTKGREGHSGLGLSVVYGIVKQSGGHIRVTSEPGRGTCFEVYWPALPAEACATAEISQAPAARQQDAALRVLLVEDQAELRQGLRRFLEQASYQVVEAESAEDALALAARPDAPIDVLATDLVLRGGDGISLLAKLRGERPRLHAVLFSGHGDALGRALRELPEDVLILHKPFAPEALPRAIRDLLVGPRAGGPAFD